MISEKEIHTIQTSITGRVKELRRLHLAWNGYKRTLATTLQEWDSTPDSERSMNPKALFPIRSEIDINSPYTTRESIMERSRKVDSALQEVIREEKAQFNQICAILGLYSLIKL